jgi:hypothetical protein
MKFEDWKRRVDAICRERTGVPVDECVGVDAMRIARSFHRDGSPPQDFVENFVLKPDSAGEEISVREIESDPLEGTS